MLIITSEQKVKLSVAPVTAAGNPAIIESATWSVSDSNVGSLDVAADGLSAYFTSIGLGECQVNCLIDADLSEGVRELVCLTDIRVVGAEAVSVSIIASTPELK